MHNAINYPRDKQNRLTDNTKQLNKPNKTSARVLRDRFSLQCLGNIIQLFNT